MPKRLWDTGGAIEELLALGLPEGEWALFGSAPLLLRGWIDSVNDLDVITRGAAWERVQEIGEAEEFENGRKMYRIGDDLTFGNYWYFGDFDIDELIDTAEPIAGVPCVLLEHIVTYKRIADRPRDREHLAAIEART